MTLRPPQSLRPRRADDLLQDPFREEAAAERVASLVRLNRALASALERLESAARRFREAGREARDEARRHWRRRHAEAGEALWNVLIQRETCGLHRHEGYLREFGVPGSVHLLMGPAATAMDPPDPPPLAEPDPAAPDRTSHPA